MALRISPNTLGLMAASLLPMIEREDLENILYRERMEAYGRGISLKEMSLRKVSILVCDLAHAIEEEIGTREALYPKDTPLDMNRSKA
jgi:hypothetical protein